MKSAVYEERLGRWEVLYLPKITFIDISLDCHVPNFLVRARKVPRIHQQLIDKIHIQPRQLYTVHAECWWRWNPSVVTTWRCDNASSGCCCKTGDTRWAEHHLATVLPEYVHYHLLLRTMIQFWNSKR